MLESQLCILIKSVVDAGLIVRGLSAIVKQDFQPRQQGTPSTPVIFFHRISRIPWGWTGRKDEWNETNGNFDHTETQFLESRYQFNALVPQSPATPTLPTAADYLSAVALSLQSDVTLQTLFNSQVGIQHIQPLTTIFFTNDKGQFEENPTFDVVFAHLDSFLTATPKIDVFAPNVSTS